MTSNTSSPVTWVLETEVFPSSHKAMREAVRNAGHQVLRWKDTWLEKTSWPEPPTPAVVFHGSLGVADAIARTSPWRPGALCNTEAFFCSNWYPAAHRWLLHRRWVVSTVGELVADSEKVLGELGSQEAVFIRPDSPLKPFSGRVLDKGSITLEALDHGFYYDDEAIPIVVAPTRAVGREWRYVVVGGKVVAGSAYSADTRSSLPDTPGGSPWRFAESVAAELPAPQGVYVLDVCEADGQLFLLELNPFSGADLYACARDRVVEAVSTHVAAVALVASSGG